MTRLKNSDICSISSSLTKYDHYLQSATGQSLLGVACHAFGVDKTDLIHQIKVFSIHVVPVTSGQGIITGFCQTICSILKYLGFDAQVAGESDTSGLVAAFENKADAFMMADDDRFVGINLHTRRVVDNSVATGRVFATVLDLMAGGINDYPVLVMGCGPVGEAGAKFLLRLGARVALHDIEPEAVNNLKNKLSSGLKNSQIYVVDDLVSYISKYPYILEATPSANTIPDELISDHLVVSAPGVPLGVSRSGCKMMKNRLVHDKLELGVAAMAVNLVLNRGG